MTHQKISKKVQWDSRRIRALRQHLGATQQELSEELGVRQQTVSEWELGKYQPRGACARVLTMVAERAGFPYGTGPGPEAVNGDQIPGFPYGASPGPKPVSGDQIGQGPGPASGGQFGQDPGPQR